MVDKRDLGKMEEYFINKDIELILVNRLKNNLEYLESLYEDLAGYAAQIKEEIDDCKMELNEMGVDF